MWEYSPRQIMAFFDLSRRRRKRELRELLAIETLAARGDQNAVRKALKDDDP